jgi:curli biogenesis system outer membrane secretion channel CsgG
MNRFTVAFLSLVLVLGAFVIPAQAKRPVIGVAEFKNTSGAAWWRGGMGWDLAGLVVSELSSSGEFRVVERQQLERVLNEQNLGASGRIRRGTAAKIGKITGAQYLVMGTVTSYEESVAGTGGGISIGPFSIGGKEEKAYISVDLRVVDTTTGEIAYSRPIEANTTGGGLTGGVNLGIFSGNLGGFEKTPAGKAVRACIIEIVEYLECAMVYQDSCMDEYRSKERKRREKTKKSISLDQ